MLLAAEEHCGQQGSLTGVQLEEQLDGVVVQVAAVQDHLDERRQAALTRRRYRHRAGHVQGAEHWNTQTHTDPKHTPSTDPTEPQAAGSCTEIISCPLDRLYFVTSLSVSVPCSLEVTPADI